MWDWGRDGVPLALCAALKRQRLETLRTLEVALRATGGQHEVRGWVHAYRLNVSKPIVPGINAGRGIKKARRARRASL